MQIRVKLAEKYGFCSGVRIADIKVRRFAIDGGIGAILGQVVHNERVVSEMESMGMRTVETIDEVTEPAIVFSAHGVPPSFHDHAHKRGLEVLDTTCTFVYDIHREAGAALEDGCHLVFIGESGHREVVGYTHDLDPEDYHVVSSLNDAQAVDWSVYSKIRLFYQTTLNAEHYEETVRHIEKVNSRTIRADTICYATKENQTAAEKLAADPEVELIFVIGGTKSANTHHLWEITSKIKPSKLIQGPDDIDSVWLQKLTCVGITAGASTPDSLIEEVVSFLEQYKNPE
ncbi:MAG: 4-hydroxy-3-methylbut-2-enyl diphosphate reductase [Thermoanaerobaculales bacterium]|nr:4-hydroxy-3-methylbut-2-enyl diphosphate reductase [Thermoanaerobaculales bacterium]